MIYQEAIDFYEDIALKKLIFPILFVCFSILTGCNTLQINYKGSNKGQVILSLTANKENPIQTYTLRIRKRDKSATGGFGYVPHNLFRPTPCDFEERYYHGFVKVLKLEPGEYEVFNFVLGTGSGIIYTAKEDFSAPFTVKERETIYIGEYWFTPIKGTSFLGFRKWEFYVALSDRGGRDIPIAIKKEPTIRDDWIKVQVPVGDRFGN